MNINKVSGGILRIKAKTNQPGVIFEDINVDFILGVDEYFVPDSINNHMAIIENYARKLFNCEKDPILIKRTTFAGKTSICSGDKFALGKSKFSVMALVRTGDRPDTLFALVTWC
jgi:hypothetical protein